MACYTSRKGFFKSPEKCSREIWDHKKYNHLTFETGVVLISWESLATTT